MYGKQNSLAFNRKNCSQTISTRDLRGEIVGGGHAQQFFGRHNMDKGVGAAGKRKRQFDTKQYVNKALALGDPRGHAGILVMCDQQREQRAMHEVADLVNEDLEEHCPLLSNVLEKNVDALNTGGYDMIAAEENKYRSVADELASELAELQGSSANPSPVVVGVTAVPLRGPTALRQKFKSKRARFLELGCRGVGVVWLSDTSDTSDATLGPREGPAASALSQAHAQTTSTARQPMMEAVHRLMEATLVSKVKRTRYVSRIVPLQVIVSASKDDIVLAVRKLAAGYTEYAGPGAGIGVEPRSFRVELRSRNNTNFDKHGTQSAVTSAMVSCGFSRDFTGGCVIVLVEVIKTFAGVSLLSATAWERYSKYNIRVVGESEQDRAARIAMSNVRAASGAVTGEELADADADEFDDASAALGSGAQTWVPGKPAPVKRPRQEPSQHDPPLSETVRAPSAVQHVKSDHVTVAGVSGLGRFQMCVPPEEPQLSKDGDGSIAYLEYSMTAHAQAHGQCMAISHTFTPQHYRGKGVAVTLCDAAFAYAATLGVPVAAQCTFVRDKYTSIAHSRGWTTRDGLEWPAATTLDAASAP